MRIELNYSIVSLGYLNVRNFSFPYKKNRNFYSAKIKIIMDTYNKKIPDELTCFLFNTQVSLSSNHHCTQIELLYYRSN